MNFDRNSFVLIIVSVLFYLGYQHYLDTKYPDRFKRFDVEQVSPAPEEGGKLVVEVAEPSNIQMSETEVKLTQLGDGDLVLENDVLRYHFNQELGSPDSIILKEYQNDMRSGLLEISEHPFILQATTNPRQIGRTYNFSGVRDGNSLKFSRTEGEWQVSQIYQIPESGYGMNIRLEWKNLSKERKDLYATTLLQSKVDYDSPSGSSFLFPGVANNQNQFIIQDGKDIDRHVIHDFCKNNKTYAKSQHHFAFLGFDKHYFMKVLIPAFSGACDLVFELATPAMENSCETISKMRIDLGSVASGESSGLDFRAWFGPKSTELLANYDMRLEESLDLGFFAKISHLLFAALRIMNQWIGNWGLAIILFTVVLKFLFYPIVLQVAASQAKMKKLQPEMNKIREKYKDNPQMQQQEMMRFMSQHKVNPFKSCLPMLLQIPVFFAFYRVLSTSIELRHAPFYGWITDLSVADPYYITPIFLGALMLVQQKMTPTAGIDKATERIMLVLPLFFAVMMLTMPAGMVLYMLANTIFSVIQQQMMNKKLAN